MIVHFFFFPRPYFIIYSINKRHSCLFDVMNNNTVYLVGISILLLNSIQHRILKYRTSVTSEQEKN